jgi:MFS family permease
MSWRSRWFLTHRIGYALSLVWLVASLSNLFSAAVARRLGLVKAMVCTHLPSAVFLALVPLGLVVSGWHLLVFLLLGDAVLGSMDQAPREAFVAAVFLPRERTQVLGTLNFVRTLGACLGPIVTGMLWTKERWWVPFELAASLKIIYDIGLLIMFLRTPLPEEHRRAVLDAERRGADQHHVGMTAAEMDVNVLMDQLHSDGSGGLAHPSEFDVDDDEDEDGDLGQYKPLVREVS